MNKILSITRYTYTRDQNEANGALMNGCKINVNTQIENCFFFSFSGYFIHTFALSSFIELLLLYVQFLVVSFSLSFYLSLTFSASIQIYQYNNKLDLCVFSLTSIPLSFFSTTVLQLKANAKGKEYYYIFIYLYVYNII